MLETRYTLSGTSPLGYDETVARVREALAGRGFGVLCEIDVRQTLRTKLGVETEPYVILGACNPPLAHRALTIEPELGVFLPCNVVVYEQQDGRVRVSAIDPEQMATLTGNEELVPVAAEVGELLQAVVNAVTE
jgi:uncharacterized protein (DUF302 family)